MTCLDNPYQVCHNGLVLVEPHDNTEMQQSK